MKKNDEMPETPTVHHTKDGVEYVHPADIINSKAGQRVLERLFEANLVPQKAENRSWPTSSEKPTIK